MNEKRRKYIGIEELRGKLGSAAASSQEVEQEPEEAENVAVENTGGAFIRSQGSQPEHKTKVISPEEMERLRIEAREAEAERIEENAVQRNNEIQELIERGRQSAREGENAIFDGSKWSDAVISMLQNLPRMNENLTAEEINLDARELAKGEYVMQSLAARGAESVLFKAREGGTTFCVKAIRNCFDKLFGNPATKNYSSVLTKVSYRTKVRHLKNEFDIAKVISDNDEADDMPVRIYLLRKRSAWFLELGFDMVMEFINGYNFADKSLVRAMKMPDKVRACYKMAKALGYLHAKKIVHLDIKPSNFMLDKFGHVRIIDFGVSVLSGSSSKAITGTIGYLSPEQIARTELTPQTDIFALGVVFGVLFGGKPLTQTLEECSKKSAKTEALKDLAKNTTSAVVELPELTQYPELANIISSCSIWCRSRRLQSSQQVMLLIKQFALENGIDVEN